MCFFFVVKEDREEIYRDAQGSRDTDDVLKEKRKGGIELPIE